MTNPKLQSADRLAATVDRLLTNRTIDGPESRDLEDVLDALMRGDFDLDELRAALREYREITA